MASLTSLGCLLSSLASMLYAVSGRRGGLAGPLGRALGFAVRGFVGGSGRQRRQSERRERGSDGDASWRVLHGGDAGGPGHAAAAVAHDDDDARVAAACSPRARAAPTGRSRATLHGLLVGGRDAAGIGGRLVAGGATEIAVPAAEVAGLGVPGDRSSRSKRRTLVFLDLVQGPGSGQELRRDMGQLSVASSAALAGSDSKRTNATSPRETAALMVRAPGWRRHGPRPRPRGCPGSPRRRAPDPTRNPLCRAGPTPPAARDPSRPRQPR